MTWFIVGIVSLLLSHFFAFVAGCRLGAGHILDQLETPIRDVAAQADRMFNKNGGPR